MERSGSRSPSKVGASCEGRHSSPWQMADDPTFPPGGACTQRLPRREHAGWLSQSSTGRGVRPCTGRTCCASWLGRWRTTEPHAPMSCRLISLPDAIDPSIMSTRCFSLNRPCHGSPFLIYRPHGLTTQTTMWRVWEVRYPLSLSFSSS